MKPEWPCVFQFPKQRHDKLLDLQPVDLGVVIEAGQVHQFDMNWTRSRVSRPKKILHNTYQQPETAIIDDEYVQEIAREQKANVFMSDEVAAAIMCSTRASYSWDVQIKKFQNLLFIDKRVEDGTQTMLDMQTVSESAPNDWTPIDDDTVNGVR